MNFYRSFMTYKVVNNLGPEILQNKFQERSSISKYKLTHIFTFGEPIQWQFSDFFSEDNFVFILKGLHIVMATLSAIGDLV